MWQRNIKKTIFTLDINNEYSKELTDLTYPYIKQYAHKIGADFHIINERKFPDFPITYEKLQVYELSQQMENDWNIFIDCDTLIHPDLMDITSHIPFDHVCHFDADIASYRWKYDRHFIRDGRHIGSCTWFVVSSSLCTELWKPVDDMTLDEIEASIFPIKKECNAGYTPLRLIEDYVLSRNIAKYGLKYISFNSILKNLEQDGQGLLLHFYMMPVEEKVVRMKQTMKHWNLL
jgi:hypothetical protein